ncbi:MULTISPECIES: leucine-rich repeat protein [Gordonibacter]|uniref:Leucine-rich repeat protein n=1 Tax=Gordonibacter faecis TaxID=3047475 RepID=A0ABT7DJW7_9ACTN|nr:MULTISPECIES: leucine-rich repeat protein [unclassified Gordonibacter]MDJ1649819.1 leucine-rich repeat protein [Gordonibacter sp. KGMB12511]HIW75484.1 leucine-rich repeat domain-containing protein [Candidatus Gordonibacter avicola]
MKANTQRCISGGRVVSLFVALAFVVAFYGGGSVAAASVKSGESAAQTQAVASVPLSQNPRPAVGELYVDGLVFRIMPGGTSVALVGWYGEAPTGDVVVPARVTSGADSYSVMRIGAPNANGSADEKAADLFANTHVTSISLPASIEEIADEALSDCSTLTRILVSPDNKHLASFDGMLFTHDYSQLLLIPPSKEGAALIPDQTALVPASVFSRCGSLLTVEVGEGSAALSSHEGLLCTKNGKSLIACLPAAGKNVVLPVSVESIAPQAFAGCAVESVNVLGRVSEIADDAFEKAAKTAVITVTETEDAAAHKAVWEAAGFSRFVTPGEPAEPSAAVAKQPSATPANSDNATPLATSQIRETAKLLPGVYLANARSTFAPISVTAPLAVTFGDGNGYDIANPAKSIVSTGYFENTGRNAVRLASVTSTNKGIDQVLQAKASAPTLDTQKLFSVYPSSDISKVVDFGYNDQVEVAASDRSAFAMEANNKLACTYRLNLDNAEVKEGIADNGMSVLPLATVSCLFELVPGQGKEDDNFYLKDNKSGMVYSLAEVKTHANDLSAKGEQSIYRALYDGYVADETAYTCRTKWGETYYDVRVIGVNHDKKASGTGTAGLTFQFTNLLNSEYRMKAENVSEGGWGTAELRISMNEGEIWAMVPSDLQEVIEPVVKEYGFERNMTTDGLRTSNDKLFLASYFELTGSVDSRWLLKEWLAGEGKQYEYWVGKVENNYGPNPNLIKGYQSDPKTPVLWWERSIFPDTDTHFFRVIHDGNPSNNGSASAPGGICPCFCL